MSNPLNASVAPIIAHKPVNGFAKLICTANQLTGFYVRATLAFNGLNFSQKQLRVLSLLAVFSFQLLFTKIKKDEYKKICSPSQSLQWASTLDKNPRPSLANNLQFSILIFNNILCKGPIVDLQWTFLRKQLPAFSAMK